MVTINATPFACCGHGVAHSDDNTAASAAAVAEIESFYLLNDHLPAKWAVPFQNGRPFELGGNFKNWKIAAHLRPC